MFNGAFKEIGSQLSFRKGENLQIVPLQNTYIRLKFLLERMVKKELHTFSALGRSSKEAGPDSIKKLAQKRNFLSDYLTVQKSLKVVKKNHTNRLEVLKKSVKRLKKNKSEVVVQYGC
jgi:excinuclease UvrABC helicase subunit UvrB